MTLFVEFLAEIPPCWVFVWIDRLWNETTTNGKVEHKRTKLRHRLRRIRQRVEVLEQLGAVHGSSKNTDRHRRTPAGTEGARKFMGGPFRRGGCAPARGRGKAAR